MLILSKFADNTYVKLTVGITLMVTALYDLVEETELGLQSEHGIVVFSLVHLLRVLPELQHGASEIVSTRNVNEE